MLNSLNSFRDELCRSGDVLSSPALNYNLLHLSAAVEQQKQQKLLKETPNEEETEARTAEVLYHLEFKNPTDIQFSKENIFSRRLIQTEQIIPHQQVILFQLVTL